MTKCLSYPRALDILERELRKDNVQIDRHSVEVIMLMIPVIMLSEIYDVKVINVASDLKRRWMKEAV